MKRRRHVIVTWRLLFLYSLCCSPGEEMRLKGGGFLKEFRSFSFLGRFCLGVGLRGSCFDELSKLTEASLAALLLPDFHRLHWHQLAWRTIFSPFSATDPFLRLDKPASSRLDEPRQPRRLHYPEEDVKRRTRIAQETFFSGRQFYGQGGGISTAQAVQHAAFLAGAGQAHPHIPLTVTRAHSNPSNQ